MGGLRFSCFLVSTGFWTHERLFFCSHGICPLRTAGVRTLKAVYQRFFYQRSPNPSRALRPPPNTPTQECGRVTCCENEKGKTVPGRPLGQIGPQARNKGV